MARPRSTDSSFPAFGAVPALLVLLALLPFAGAASGAGFDPPPGVVIDHHPTSTRAYIGSPALAVLPSGEYVASHDFFGPGSNRRTSIVFGSGDRGATWSRRAEIDGQWWSSLFVHEEALYLMGTSAEYGFCVIRRSTDGGATWTTPTDAASGLLHGDGKYHTAPMPVLIHEGRLWRAMEDAQGPGKWGRHFRAFMMSAPVGADLLRADSWTSSNRLGWNGMHLGGTFGGWLEGNAVVAPDGRVVNVLRADHPGSDEKAAIITISEDGRRAEFDRATGFVDFPGGAKKFTIRRDPKAGSDAKSGEGNGPGEGYYWTLCNWVPPARRGPKPASIRNTLALARSADLRAWEVRAILIEHPDPVHHGYQYADWLFEGDDLIAVVRTAHDDEFGGAVRQHDANYMTFHRIEGFRSRTTPLP